ncbi:hypothetical protein OKW37_000043 [Paraburkholderia sp. MM5482-R2]
MVGGIDGSWAPRRYRDGPATGSNPGASFARVAIPAAILSLRAVDASRPPDILLSLREGDYATPQSLEPFLPGLADVQWRFAVVLEEYPLETTTDDVVITLSMRREPEPSSFLAEGLLRGLAARLVVTAYLWCEITTSGGAL